MPTTSELTAKFIWTLSDKDLEGLGAMGCESMAFITPDYDGTGGKTFSEYLSKWTGGFPDYVLEAGDSFITQEHRRAVLYAIAPARISLEARYSRKPTMATFRKFQAMPLTKAAR